MSSTSEAMANQGLLYEEQDHHHHQISTTQMGFLPFFPPNLSFVNPPLSCHQSTLKSFTNTTTPSSLPAPDHVHHLPSSAETLLSSHTKQREDNDSDVLGGANLLSLQRSSTPTNLWTWGDINQSLSYKRNSTVDDYDNHHHHHLGVTAMKMKKIKARRKVREPRFCFKTMSDVDVLDDGYKWRKYGQKVVKNTQHPRSYYRCTQDNCRVKKRVERLAEDPRMVITTYEGRHVHSPSHDQEDSSQTQCQLNNLFW